MNLKKILIPILLLAAVLTLFPAASVLAWPVPDTGQTKCYDDVGNVIPCPNPGERFYGQDGNYNINPMSFTKLGGGTMVLDNVTGLTWEVKNNLDGTKNYANPNDADNTYTWYDSNLATNGGIPGTPGDGTDTEDFIAALNNSHFGGYSDWRLPTIKELDSIVDMSFLSSGTTINTSYFPNMPSDAYYWSSTAIDQDVHSWDLEFRWGIRFRDDSYRGQYVRAVRGGQSITNFVDNGDGTATDTSTGLTWQQATAPGTYTWEAALAYCEGLTLGGYLDWRLPTRKELLSIVDYSKYPMTYAFFNIAWGPSPNYSDYWSSTTLGLGDGNGDEAWTVDFWLGYGFYEDKNSIFFVRAVRGGQPGPVNNLLIVQSPMSGPPGTTFTEWGTGFTPNSTATLHFKKPDGTEYPTQPQTIDAIGHFEITYTAPYDKPPSTYTWWAVDGETGKESNRVSYVITPLSAGLDVQTINPQSDRTLFNNFFPSPNPDLLISGGGISTVIAADGESCLLLRIVADNDPGLVTITESGQDTQQNGSISDLDHYRDGSTASSVDIELKPYGSQFIGFAVYRAPKDFSISDYENRLTRPITLDVTSAGGNLNIPLTLRRPPIMISHGLWSSAWGNPDIENFRNMLWDRFEDRGGKNILDYIWMNDCLQQNASAFVVGASKTRSNIKEFLDFLRKRGATVTKVDYLGHSMGGIWGRLIQQRYSKDPLTYESGYLHKLITLDTPHGGSFIADIGQFVLDNADFAIWPFPNASDYLCAISIDYQRPVCFGAIKDLTSYGCVENLKGISVPCHAILGNKPIDTSCALLSASSWVSGGSAEPIVKILQVSEWILKKINPDYGCENWFNQFDFSTETDLIVDLSSQKGGLSGNQLSQFEHKHTASFYAEVNQCFFDLLNKGINDDAFAPGFPASSTLLDSQRLLALKTASTGLLFSSNQAALGNIQVLSPVDGSTVQPGELVNVMLALTGTLALKNVLIMAPGSDSVELVNPPYATAFTVPADAYGAFVISALGEGTDGNLYAASATLSVNNTAALQKVDVSQSLYLDLGQQMAISVTGTYSDGTVRDLNTGAQGTTYASSDENMLSVSSDGMVTPKAVGVGYVQVKPAASEPVIVRVEISGSYMATVQKLFIGYYLRPAAPAGLVFWAEKWADEEAKPDGNIKNVIESFANTPESQAIWGGITEANIDEFINKAFQSLFGRDAAPYGLNFYHTGFTNGTFTPGTIVYDIFVGAPEGSHDKAVLDKKLAFANAFTAILEPNPDANPLNDQATYSGQIDAAIARDMLAAVGEYTVIDSAAIKQQIKDQIADPGDPILN